MRLTDGNLALAQAITIHPSAKRSPTQTRIIKPVGDNKKLGKGGSIITKNKWRGMPVYQMSLEERATCPTTCQQWANCFGNNMAFGHRIDHTHPEFLTRLEAEIDALAHTYRFGFVIRPHVLGDYYSVAYAQFWVRMTEKHKNLRIFGYTHWPRDSDIGKVVAEWNKSDRVWIRFSDQGGDMSANVDGEGIQCPQQTGKTNSCLTCALCWSTTKPIAFKEH